MHVQVHFRAFLDEVREPDADVEMGVGSLHEQQEQQQPQPQLATSAPPLQHVSQNSKREQEQEVAPEYQVQQVAQEGPGCQPARAQKVQSLGHLPKVRDLCTWPQQACFVQVPSFQTSSVETF